MADVRQIFQVSSTTVREWKGRGMPMTEDGRYPIPQIIQWWREREVQRQLRNGNSKSIEQTRFEKLRAEIGKLNEEIRNKQFVNNELDGELVRYEDVERDVAAIISELRTALMSLPDELAKLVPDEMKAVTKQKCNAKVRAWLTATYTAIVAGTTPRQAILSEAERLRSRRS